MAKVDVGKMLLGPLVGGTFYDSPIARFLNVKNPDDKDNKDDKSAVQGMRRGGKVKKMAKGGSTASKRADGCAVKGKTRGKMV